MAKNFMVTVGQYTSLAFLLPAATFVGYVIGYLLKTTATGEPLGLLADMLYTFGFALWTAAVIVVLLEVIPDIKRRQIRGALEAYEATRGNVPTDTSAGGPGSREARG